jgi:HAD superfamily, subfamily IIIB (Acid phosphatase)
MSRNRRHRSRPARMGTLVALVLVALGCAPNASVRKDAGGFITARDAAAMPDLVAARRAVSQYIGSGRYEADIASVVAEARRYLQTRARAGGRLAIIIDETSLSNLPALEANQWGYVLGGPCDLPRGPCGVVRWIEMARSDPILPVRDLASLARRLGVAVFFITGRAESMREATERNLRAAGYEWTGLVLRPDGQPPPSAADFKAPERKRIADQGYAIVVNVGDQVSDLAGGHAERAYKLPNPIYLIP